MPKNAKIYAIVALFLAIGVGLLFLAGSKSGDPHVDGGDLRSHQAPKSGGSAAQRESDRTGSKEDRERKLAVKQLEEKLQNLEVARLVERAETTNPKEITPALRKSYKLPADVTSASLHIESVLVESPDEAEIAEIRELISATFESKLFAGSDAWSDFRSELEKQYLNYPKKYKILTKSRLSLALDRESFSIVAQDADEIGTREYDNGSRIVPMDGNVEPEYREFGDARSRYGKLFGFKE